MDLDQVCEHLLRKCLGLKDGEQFLVVTDELERKLAEPFYRAGQKIGAESLLLVIKERKRSGEEPPIAVAAALTAADAAVCITQYSMTHTKARKQAVAAGTRLATMPGITEDMFVNGAITADYAKVRDLTLHMTELLDQGSSVRIEKEGHALTFSIKDRKGVPSPGVYLNPGESGNLPSGEAFIAPIEGSASGEIFVDASVVGVGKLTHPLILTVENGRLINANGEGEATLLRILGEDQGRSVAEFGIGTNKWARITGNVLEDEKVYGTVHIAFGSNLTFGGTVDAGVHIDCVFSKPDLWIDGQKVMDHGNLIY
ncbi:MAG: aminopeptidase [Sporolactobacillus sp.]|uniref:aminopeptidase n=1 Tax=Sporolactobacillus sp. STSJ-5 TaxID=2965076 RepID=UPI0021031AC3|nr:aminopeptidase [Sporolactobacillus sp. STSJ-5]MCQ2009901.1 aminopeptidase [Sporolactobacillus sp. STSJ-5]